MKTEWNALRIDVGRRLVSIVDPPRLMYFVFVVVGIGGLGVWQSTALQFRANLATYAMGIAAAAAVELVLPEATSRSLRMLALSLAILAIAASLLYTQFAPIQVAWVGPVDIVWAAPICAWLLWILSASSNVNIGSPNPSSATGGDTDDVAGDLSGFQT